MLHKRTLPVKQAERELDEYVGDWIFRHKLTYGEVTRILCGVLQVWAKYQIREERHPKNPDKRGDEA